jgi:acyl-CoA thioesterase FadM
VSVHDFEVARLEAMAAAGRPLAAQLTQGYTVVASDLFVQYRAPAFSEDLLEVQSCIAHFRGARMTWQ